MVLCMHTDPSCLQLRCTSTQDWPSALLVVPTIGAKSFFEVSIGSIQVKSAGRQESHEFHIEYCHAGRFSLYRCQALLQGSTKLPKGWAIQAATAPT